MSVRTRIAPSPTGEYTVGNLRTVLYDYALARKNKGQFIVRIEDTDRNRLVEGAMERILMVFKDYGLCWDEGPEVGGPYAPYLQSERLDIYKKYAKELVDNGHAYYCFCTPERLQKLRNEQQARGEAKTSYDKHCRSLAKEEVEENLKKDLPYVVRLKVPENETIVLHDFIHGDISFNTNEVEDAILLKSDGFPTYHLAAMVDDHLMKITHVLRGIEWLTSSPLHILLYNFFDWELPIFVHLPLLKEKGSNTKLSKRFGSVAAADFLKDGYLPEATLNLLMFIGWNPGTEKEIYTLEEFVQDFSLEKVQKTDLAVFDREKLAWLNGHYIRQLSVEKLMKKLKDWAQKFDVKLNISEKKDYDLKVLGLVQERMKTLAEFNELVSYFYQEPTIDKELLVKQTKSPEKTKEILEKFYKLYSELDKKMWVKENLDELSHKLLEKNGYKPKEAFMTVRIAVTGVTATPPIFDTIEVLGQEKTLERIKSNF
jgi:glutamyl-tRNA synthetase